MESRIEKTVEKTEAPPLLYGNPDEYQDTLTDREKDRILGEKTQKDIDKLLKTPIILNKDLVQLEEKDINLNIQRTEKELEATIEQLLKYQEQLLSSNVLTNKDKDRLNQIEKELKIKLQELSIVKMQEDTLNQLDKVISDGEKDVVLDVAPKEISNPQNKFKEQIQDKIKGLEKEIEAIQKALEKETNKKKKKKLEDRLNNELKAKKSYENILNNAGSLVANSANTKDVDNRTQAQKDQDDRVIIDRIIGHIGDADGELSKIKDSIGHETIKTQFEDTTLSQADIKTIREYMNDGYFVNVELREGSKLSSYDKEFVNKMDIALKKFPKYEGDLKRVINKPVDMTLEETLKPYVPGAKIKFDAYTSTSKDNGKGKVDLGGAIYFNIKDSTEGRDISKYNGKEQEVIYERGAEFIITGVTEKDGKYHIDMVENKGENKLEVSPPPVPPRKPLPVKEKTGEEEEYVNYPKKSEDLKEEALEALARELEAITSEVDKNKK